jgi:hypothetical protein
MWVRQSPIRTADIIHLRPIIPKRRSMEEAVAGGAEKAGGITTADGGTTAIVMA